MTTMATTPLGGKKTAKKPWKAIGLYGFLWSGIYIANDERVMIRADKLQFPSESSHTDTAFQQSKGLILGQSSTRLRSSFAGSSRIWTYQVFCYFSPLSSLWIAFSCQVCRSKTSHQVIFSLTSAIGLRWPSTKRWRTPSKDATMMSEKA